MHVGVRTQCPLMGADVKETRADVPTTPPASSPLVPDDCSCARTMSGNGKGNCFDRIDRMDGMVNRMRAPGCIASRGPHSVHHPVHPVHPAKMPLPLPGRA